MTVSPITISGTVSDQTTTSEAPVRPFATMTVADANAGETDTLTITLTCGGTLADGSGFAGLIGKTAGYYTLTGTAATITSELQALVFTPVAGAPETQTTTDFTLNASASKFGETPTVLASFDGTNETNPNGALYADAAGDLFGTAGNSAGGLSVFELAKTGSGYRAPVTIAETSATNSPALSGDLVADAAGDLFGTSVYGGTNGDGTVFELVKTSTGYAEPSILANFGTGNGVAPGNRLVVDATGDLFGVTGGDGTGGSGDGTVFELMKTASGYSAPVTLASFIGEDYAPTGGLLADAAGDLFGTTYYGLTTDAGSVFELVKTASGFSAPVTLATFDGTDGGRPNGSLIADAAGDLFGTTVGGGGDNDGTVFEVKKTGLSYSAPITLASFNGLNGSTPEAGDLVADAAGDLFGTTETGGAVGSTGTVFELVKTANGYTAPVTLVTFDGADGDNPLSSLTVDAAGDLFGTASQGGATGNGTVFELTAAQIAAADAATATASVTNINPGQPPQISGTVAGQTTTSDVASTPFAATVITDSNAGAIDTLTIALAGGAGTLADGGTFSGLVQNQDGTYALTGSAAGLTSELQALEFTPAPGAPGTQTTTTFALSDSTSHPVTTLASFDGENGAGAEGSLIADAAGDLFGTTNSGGTSNDGTVFELVKTGSSYGGPITLASFDGTNGAGPQGSLIADAAGDLFGTTDSGGTSNDGTVFELVKTGSSYGAPITLASFDGTNGSGPQGSLIADAAGDLFGTTEAGGASNDGTVFELVKTGSSYGAPITLVSFDGPNGANPVGSLLVDAAGDLFGTTQSGSGDNAGTVFELVKTGSGYATSVTLASFDGANGGIPDGSLIADAAGDLFGTTSNYGGNGGHGSGTVFELVKSGSGYSAPVTLASFNGSNGRFPSGDLIADAEGDLFGTATQGGQDGDGTVFELKKTAAGYGALVTLASFDGTNGEYPISGLITDSAGDLYGTAGSDVFELTKSEIAAATATASIIVRGAGNTIELVNNASLTASNAVINMDPNASATVSGADDRIVLGSGDTVTVNSSGPNTITLASGGDDVTATGSGLTIYAAESGDVLQIGGAARLQIDAGATLTLLGDGLVTGQSIVFAPNDLKNGAHLVLEAVSGGRIAGLAVGDSIDFAGADVTGATISGAVLTVTTSGGASANFASSTSLAGLSPVLASDNNGGTLLSFAAASVTTQTTSYTLADGVNVVTGATSTNDVFVADTASFAKGDVLTGGPNYNTLRLSGGGKFNLDKPGTLSLIDTIEAHEGQAASNGLASTRQTVLLRDGADEALVVDNASKVIGNTRAVGISIYGGSGTYAMTLGAGHDQVWLGSGSAVITLGKAGNQIYGGNGNATILANVNRAAALIEGNGVGLLTLELIRAGAVTLNAADTNLDVVLRAGSTLNLSSQGGVTADGSAGACTITAHAAGQTLIGGNGDTLVSAGGDTFAFNGSFGANTIEGFVASGASHDTLAISNSLFADWAHLLGATTQSGSDLLITVDSADTILLKNVSLTAFTSSDVKFV